MMQETGKRKTVEPVAMRLSPFPEGIASASRSAVSLRSFRFVMRKGIVLALLFAAAPVPAHSSPSAARPAGESGDHHVSGMRLSGGGYTATLAAHEMRETARNGLLEKVKYFLAVWPELLDARDEDGMTPLFLAAAFGHAEVARMFLDRGADMHASNRAGAMPFHQAAYSGHGKVVELFLDRGEKVDVRDRDDRTALHLTAWKDQGEVARLLIEKGARVDAGDDAGGGATPLHYAAALGSTGVAALLLEHCADVGAMAKGGITPLHLAVSRKHPAMVRLLLAYDAGVMRPDAKDGTALDLAPRIGDKEPASLLRGLEEESFGSMMRQAGLKCPRGK